jgi:ribonuclease Z
MSKKYPDAYFPGSEELSPDEMRVIALGTGMPNLRPSQMSASWFVELGNGDKFFFDLGTGSISRFCGLGVDYNDANKVFLSHLHSDHVGDFAALFIGGWIEGRQVPLRIWGPTGESTEMGVKHFIDKQIESYAWDISSREGHRPVEGKQIEVNEFDFSKENHVIYDENGVVVRSWPAIHAIDGPVSFSLEWNGLKFVYGGDTSPNKWYEEYAQGADLIIHECFITTDLLQEKFGFTRQNAINVGTKVHTSPVACGMVFSLVKPRHAIAYHFYNDFEADPGVYTGLRTHYDGPLSLAKDLMVWNVTPEDIATRHVVVNPDSWPTQHGGGKPPEQLTWEPHHPMSEWLAAGRLSWPGVDEFDK